MKLPLCRKANFVFSPERTHHHPKSRGLPGGGVSFESWAVGSPGGRGPGNAQGAAPSPGRSPGRPGSQSSEVWGAEASRPALDRTIRTRGLTRQRKRLIQAPTWKTFNISNLCYHVPLATHTLILYSLWLLHVTRVKLESENRLQGHLCHFHLSFCARHGSWIGGSD